MNNIGITGAGGTLGRIFVDKLTKDGLEYSCFRGDICSKEDLKSWFGRSNFSALIHLAAVVPTTEVNSDPERAYQVNVKGTENLIEAIGEAKQNPWLFYASSAHVYKSKGTPINEFDEIDPLSVYGKTKYAAESVVSKGYDNYCIGRIFSFYHETQEKPFLYPAIISRLKEEDLSRPFELHGADSVRDFLNAEKVVDIILKLMKGRAVGIYNIGSGEGISIRDFVQGMSDKKLNIKHMGGQDYLVADISKLNDFLLNKNRKVAIVIPTFNRSVYVQESVESALCQTYPCEVIVCDHGSTDNTPEVMKKYGNKIKYIRRNEDFGPHFCWLDGILHADAEFIHLQFDDDYVDKTFIEETMKLMREDVGVVIANDLRYFHFKEIFIKSGLFPSSRLEKLLLMGAMYSPGASLFRKKDLIDALYQGGLPVSKYKRYHGVGPDAFCTLLAVLRYKKVGIITDNMVFFRGRKGSITFDAYRDPQKKAQMHNAYRDVLYYYKFLKWYWIFIKWYLLCDQLKKFRYLHLWAMNSIRKVREKLCNRGRPPII